MLRRNFIKLLSATPIIASFPAIVRQSRLEKLKEISIRISNSYFTYPLSAVDGASGAVLWTPCLLFSSTFFHRHYLVGPLSKV